MADMDMSDIDGGRIEGALAGSAQSHLRQLVEKIERLEEEKKALADDIRDVFLEAKAMGFDVKILRQVIRIRKKSATERTEEEALLDTYLHALGMHEPPVASRFSQAAE